MYININGIAYFFSSIYKLNEEPGPIIDWNIDPKTIPYLRYANCNFSVGKFILLRIW